LFHATEAFCLVVLRMLLAVSPTDSPVKDVLVSRRPEFPFFLPPPPNFSPPTQTRVLARCYKQASPFHGSFFSDHLFYRPPPFFLPMGQLCRRGFPAGIFSCTFGFLPNRFPRIPCFPFPNFIASRISSVLFPDESAAFLVLRGLSRDLRGLFPLITGAV